VTDHLPPGHSLGDEFEQELEPLLAEDNSVWAYSAESGGYTSPEQHPDVICRSAAAVADHVNGPTRTVRQWHGDVS
jgi:hypothetical protein